MPTIVDSLIVTLGLDSSKFEQGKDRTKKGLKETGDAADNAGNRLKKTAKEGGDGFNNMAVKAAKFLAIIGGTTAIKRFAEQIIESNASMDRLAKNLQENISTISAWSNSAEIAGGSAEGLQGTLDMLSKSQTELQLTGQSSLIPYFSALSVSVADASGKARAGADILLDLADRFSKMDRTTANNMGRMMGIDQGTMNLLLRGRKELELTVAKQKEYNAVTKKQGEESSRLRATIIESRQSFEAFGRELLSNAMPAIEGIFGLMKDFGEWARENKGFIEAFLTIIAVGLAAIAAATVPINLTVAAVIALSAAIAGLWDDYQTWKRGGDSFIDWSKWEPGFKAAGSGIKWLRDLLQDLVYRAIAGADVLSAVFDRDWDRVKFAAKEFVNGTGKKYGEDEPLPPMPEVEKPVAQTTQAPITPRKAGGTAEQQARLSSLEKQYGLPSGLLDNVWKTESGRGKNMLSPAGAEGHFQFMPKTAKEYGLKNPYDFDESSEAAARMYRDLIKANKGDVAKAAAAYNWGSGNLAKKGIDRAPAETVDYMRKITEGIQPPTYSEKREAAGIQPPVPKTTIEAPKPVKLYSAPMGGIPNATQAAQGAGAPSVATSNSNVTQDMSKSVEMHVGEIKVYSAATDAEGIASDIGDSMKNYLLQSQANYGLT